MPRRAAIGADIMSEIQRVRPFIREYRDDPPVENPFNKPERLRFIGLDVPVAGGAARASESLGFLCWLGLSGLSRIIVGETGIPFLEKRAERAIERAGSGLQQQVRTALRPLHLLTFGEALADDGVHR